MGLHHDHHIFSIFYDYSEIESNTVDVSMYVTSTTEMTVDCVKRVLPEVNFLPPPQAFL